MSGDIGMALVDVYDGAFFHAMSGVPSSVKAIIGYVSGPSATNIWSHSEAQAVRDSGREFWAIDVPNQGSLGGDDGAASANRMINVLPSFSYPKHCPVFMDIEYNAYMNNPAGADAAVARFKSTMNNAGYPRAFGYVPLFVGYGWGARYTYNRPSALPDGVIGWQYENDARGHSGWDASAFDPSLFGSNDPPINPDPPATYTLEDLMANINYVWWFGRLTDPPNTIYAINALNGTYFSPGTAHNISVFKERLTAAGIPWKSVQVDIEGSMTQFGILVDDA